MREKDTLLGLKPSVQKQIDRLRDRKVGAVEFVDAPFAVAMQDAAVAAGRRLGVLADRRGNVRQVFVGDAATLAVPKDARVRVGAGRLGGLRLVSVDLSGRGHTDDDLRTMRMLSLDASVTVIAGEPGRTPRVEVAWLLPVNPEGRLWEVLPPCHAGQVPVRFDETVREVEAEMRRDAARLRRGAGARGEAAIVVLPVFDRRSDVDWDLSELRSLCATADVSVAEAVVQSRDRPDPRHLIGRGKLRELAMLGLQRGADLLVFGAALTPSQQRSIAEATGVRVIDRNQLILDIFARHAHTNEGRLQVELAQLRYNLPRLSEKDDSMSRLTGGIGAQGPGETKLEMERRSARDRIRLLEGRIKAISAGRGERRRRRVDERVPMAAIVGYTNAGKSTLFNALTGASVIVQDRLFATLDPTVRRMRGRDNILLVDTVGFIRDLPEELVGAFRATIEEVEAARVLVLVADAADAHADEQIASVKRILADFGLANRPVVTVLNKADAVQDRDGLGMRAALAGAIPASALAPRSLGPVMEAIAAAVLAT